MKTKVLILSTLSVFAMTLGAYAKEDIVLKKNYSTDKIQITAGYDKGEQAVIQILPSNVSLTEFAEAADKNDKVIYTNFSVADENGVCGFEAKITSSGEYTAYICGENSGQIIKRDFVFWGSEAYKAVIDGLNSKSDESDFADFLADNIDKLGFELDIDDNLDIKAVGKQMYRELNSKKLSDDEFDANTELYKNCAVVVALNSSKCENVCAYLESVVETDADVKSYFDKYLNTVNAQKYFTKKLSGINIKSVSDLKTNIKKALVLTVTKYPDGYMSIKDVLNTFKAEYGLNSVSSSDKVYKGLASNDYDFISFITEYNKLIKDKNTSAAGGTSSGGGGGTGGGGGVRISNDLDISGVYVDSNKSQSDPQQLKIKFDDLGTVNWAYPSISRLFELGIVNGYSESEFMPQANVKREEFVKMILCASGINDFESQNYFSDVDANEWYSPYINTAYKKGIIKGIGNNDFGIGNSITRQDMALIIYNVIKDNPGFEYKSGGEFADADLIDDYAKEAVDALGGLKIINGIGDDCFAPKQNATRAETAVIIDRALSYINS